MFLFLLCRAGVKGSSMASKGLTSSLLSRLSEEAEADLLSDGLLCRGGLSLRVIGKEDSKDSGDWRPSGCACDWLLGTALLLPARLPS